jgi:hypothetical protein
MSTLSDKQSALRDRLHALDENIAALRDKFAEVSLPAVTGDADMSKELVRVEELIASLVRERAQLTAAQPSSRSSSRLSSVTPRKRGGTSGMLRRAATAIATVNGEIDVALGALRELFERRAVLILEATEVVSPSMTGKLARAGQSRSRPSTESPVAGARRRRDRDERAGQRHGFHCAPAGGRDGLIQTLTRFRRAICRQETAALRDFGPAYVRSGSDSALPRQSVTCPFYPQYLP